MPTIGDFTAPGSSVGRHFDRGGGRRSGGDGRGRRRDEMRDGRGVSLAGDPDPEAAMFDFDLAEIMRSGDLGERRDDRKIQGAGPGRRRSDANRLFQQVSRILV